MENHEKMSSTGFSVVDAPWFTGEEGNLHPAGTTQQPSRGGGRVRLTF